MTNMSYCAFENTANDMKQAMDKLADVLEGAEGRMSQHEQDGLYRMVDLAARITIMVAEASLEKATLTPRQLVLMRALAFNYCDRDMDDSFRSTIQQACTDGAIAEAEYERELSTNR